MIKQLCPLEGVGPDRGPAHRLRQASGQTPATTVSLLLGCALGEAGGEGDGSGGGSVPGDLCGVAVSRGDAQTGEQPFAYFPAQDGDEPAGGGIGGAQAQLDAHGQVPQQRSHHGADEGADCAADGAALGVGGDHLHRGDHPDQRARQSGGALDGEVLPCHQRGREEREFGGGEHPGALGGAGHVQVVGGEAPTRVGAVRGATQRGDGGDLDSGATETFLRSSSPASDGPGGQQEREGGGHDGGEEEREVRSGTEVGHAAFPREAAVEVDAAGRAAGC
ncbi:hypothetical protein [Streptomyces sp. NPDC088766]|uniref:hypothetical protein n=1 Tax=Streptomyces sp. NPDC088766 TaxID=3365893 RepID=UPI0038276E10